MRGVRRLWRTRRPKALSAGRASARPPAIASICLEVPGCVIVAPRVDAGQGSPLKNSIRSFCVFLCTALVAVTALHGLTDAQHGMAHAADWPAVALVDVDTVADQIADHVHVAPDDQSDDAVPEDVDNEGPVGHGHQVGGDSHGALPGAEHPQDDARTSRLAARTPGVAPALGDLNRDGPEYPPKRMRTVV